MFFKVHRFACMPRAEVYWFPRGASSALSQRGMEIRSGSRRLEVYASRVRCLQWRRRPGGRLCSPSSMIWYLARAFMLKAPYCWQRHRVQWTRGYCRAVLRWSSDCIEPLYKSSSALPECGDIGWDEWNAGLPACKTAIVLYTLIHVEHRTKQRYITVC